MNTTSGIYEIICNATEAFYIGSSVNIEQRWRRHREDLRAGKHHSPYLQRAWKTHGPDAFDWRIMEKVPDPANLRAREREWLKIRPAYNALRTREGVVQHSAESRARMTAAQLARAEQRRVDGTNQHTPETRAKIAASHTGKKASPEARAKMSASAKRRGAAHLHAPEIQAKSHAAQKGKPKSETARAALKVAHQNCRCPKHMSGSIQRPFEDDL